jgi:hypothetical protein
VERNYLPGDRRLVTEQEGMNLHDFLLKVCTVPASADIQIEGGQAETTFRMQAV